VSEPRRPRKGPERNCDEQRGYTLLRNVTAPRGLRSRPLGTPLASASRRLACQGRAALQQPCPTVRRLDARQSLAALDWQSGVATPNAPAVRDVPSLAPSHHSRCPAEPILRPFCARFDCGRYSPPDSIPRRHRGRRIRRRFGGHRPSLSAGRRANGSLHLWCNREW